MRVLVLERVRRERLDDIGVTDAPRPWKLWEHLREHGIDVDVWEPSPWPLNPLAGRHSLLDSLDPYRSLKVLSTRRHYDAVLAFGEGSAALLVALRGLLRFKPQVLAVDISPDDDWKLRKHLQDYTLSRVDGVLSLHAAQVPYVAERWNVPAWTVGFSVDTEFFYPMPEAPEFILSVGDDAGRDFETLIRAAESISEPLVIKTGMPVRHLSHIRVIPERLSFSAFRDLYVHARFVVLPLRPHPKNASGITVLAQAFAMGKAVIVSDADSVRDYLRHGENCLVVPPSDALSLHTAVVRLLMEPWTRERLGRNARVFAEQHFSHAAKAANLASTLQKVLAK